MVGSIQKIHNGLRQKPEFCSLLLGSFTKSELIGVNTTFAGSFLVESKQPPTQSAFRIIYPLGICPFPFL